MENEYNLALKLFKNRNLDRSFSLIHQLYLKSVSSKSVNETLLIKIFNLYLIEIGLIIRDKSLNQVQINTAYNAITSNEIMNNITSIWTDIPSEILYNYHLLNITNPELIIDKEGYLTQVKHLSYTLKKDKYFDQLLNLIKFEIYPFFDQFDESKILIGDNRDELEKLVKIKSIKKEKLIENEKRLKELDRLQMEKEKQIKELEKQQELEKTLKYRSIKEIQKTYVDNPVEPNQDQIKQRLAYVYSISKDYLSKNYLFIFVLIALVVGSTRFLKGANVKEKLIETIKMAFKFSYI